MAAPLAGCASQGVARAQLGVLGCDTPGGMRYVMPPARLESKASREHSLPALISGTPFLCQTLLPVREMFVNPVHEVEGAGKL